MLDRRTIILAVVLLVVATAAQDVVLHAKGVRPPPTKPNGAKPARQGAQHPEENLRSVVNHIRSPSTRLVEEDQLGSFAKSGALFKKRVNAREMVNYLEKVEATFDQIYFEQYLEDLQSKIDSANSRGEALEEGQYLATMKPPPTKALQFDRTYTSPDVTTTSKYYPASAKAACGAWVSLISYCGITETDTKSLSECYCTSGTDYVPDQWNSLAARCAKATFECATTSDYLCDLTEHASSSTDFCKARSDAVKFYTSSKQRVKPYTPAAFTTADSTGDDDDNSMGCNEYNDPADCSGKESSDDSDSGGSSDDSSPADADAAAAQPEPTTSAYRAPLTTTSASPGATRSTYTSHTSSSISWTTPSATSTSSAQSLVSMSGFSVCRVAQSWLLAVCALWLL